jgi:hypothetical protein
MQDALNSIMDLCESKMNENDYLIVTGELKKIYNETKKKSQGKIIKANQILNQAELRELYEEQRKISFQLYPHEQKMIMESRMKQYYEEIEISICEEIDDVVLQLKETSEEKKDAWAFVKQWRYSYSVNRENSLYEHRKLVKREKELKLRLKELRRELTMLG